MFLLIGLGNPGKKYAQHRHNVGFMAVDQLAKKYNAGAFANKFGGLLAEGIMGTERVLLFKPQSFMNNSGEPTQQLAHFYKIPLERVCVFYDELDLPLGKLRVKRGGGAGGHNGIKSLDQHIGEEYLRVRIGIGHPGDKELVTDHVLSDFTPVEQKQVDAILKIIAIHAPLLVEGDSPGFMSKVAFAMQEQDGI